LSSNARLTPFSYVILVLVGREGAGPHDLRRMAAIGRVYWDAAPSQWYAEPKRLAALGLLQAQKAPGRTRERTHYTLTDAGHDALRAWAPTPAPLPRMQHEAVVRLLAADIVDPAAVAEGLRAMEREIESAAAGVEAAEEGLEARLPHRAALLRTNPRYARRLLELQRDWLEEAQRVLESAAADDARPLQD
jgi:PadR family transcriptional regulator AphA